MMKNTTGFKWGGATLGTLWQCSCGQYHSGTPFRPGDWGSDRHQPQVDVLRQYPIDSKVIVDAPGAWAHGRSAIVKGHGVTPADVERYSWGFADGVGGGLGWEIYLDVGQNDEPDIRPCSVSHVRKPRRGGHDERPKATSATGRGVSQVWQGATV